MKNKMLKINPISDRTISQTQDYIRKNNVPCNKFHDMGSKIIGCAPRTRVVEEREEPKVGRW